MHWAVDIDSAREVSIAFAQAPAVVMDELETAMSSSLAYLYREAVERTPTAAGVLRRAYQTEQFSAFSAVFGTLRNTLPYAMPVEMGTRPHFPPVAAIQAWVEVKLGLAGEEAESAAWAIARKISRFGTPGFGMVRYALQDGRETIEQEFRDAVTRITGRMAALAGGTSGTPGAAGAAGEGAAP